MEKTTSKKAQEICKRNTTTIGTVQQADCTTQPTNSQGQSTCQRGGKERGPPPQPKGRGGQRAVPWHTRRTIPIEIVPPIEQEQRSQTFEEERSRPPRVLVPASQQTDKAHQQKGQNIHREDKTPQLRREDTRTKHGIKTNPILPTIATQANDKNNPSSPTHPCLLLDRYQGESLSLSLSLQSRKKRRRKNHPSPSHQHTKTQKRQHNRPILQEHKASRENQEKRPIQN